MICPICGQEKKKKRRSVTQNAALHLYFKHISDELNELGMEFKYEGIKGMVMETPYTEHIVKELVWKPIQLTLFGFESTTKLTTKEIDRIIMIFSRYFGEQGIEIPFPSIETFKRAMDENNR